MVELRKSAKEAAYMCSIWRGKLPTAAGSWGLHFIASPTGIFRIIKPQPQRFTGIRPKENLGWRSWVAVRYSMLRKEETTTKPVLKNQQIYPQERTKSWALSAQKESNLTIQHWHSISRPQKAKTSLRHEQQLLLRRKETTNLPLANAIFPSLSSLVWYQRREHRKGGDAMNARKREWDVHSPSPFHVLD